VSSETAEWVVLTADERKAVATDWKTDDIIGKEPRLGILTSEEPTQQLGWCGPDSKRNIRGQHLPHAPSLSVCLFL